MSDKALSKAPSVLAPDPAREDDTALSNIRYWSGGSGTRIPVIVRDGHVNFHCLAEKCKTPCCGPFEGLGHETTPCFVSSFSDLYLLEEDVSRLLRAGRGDLLEPTADGYRLRLKPDKSCAAFQQGLCSIHSIRPTVCRAFPFDFDIFAGLVMVAKCPGVNAGWTEPADFEEAIAALSKVYERWMTHTQKRVGQIVAAAPDSILTKEDLPEGHLQ